jgi:ABC-type transporter Mla subunit MlaD
MADYPMVDRNEYDRDYPTQYRVEERDGALPRALEAMEKAIAQNMDSIDQLAERLQPILHDDVPMLTRNTDEVKAAADDRSAVTQRVDGLREGVEEVTRRVGVLLRRVDL